MSELRRTSRKAAAAAASSQLKWIHRWKFCRGIQPILSTRATHSILVYAVFIKLAVGPVTVVNLVTVMMERGKREMINDSRILIPDSFSTQLVGGNVCQRILVRARIFYDMKNRDLVICRYNRLEVSQNERLNRSPTLCPMQKKKKKKWLHVCHPDSNPLPLIFLRVRERIVIKYTPRFCTVITLDPRKWILTMDPDMLVDFRWLASSKCSLFSKHYRSRYKSSSN